MADTLADGCNFPSDFMSGDHGLFKANGSKATSMIVVQIRAANAACINLNGNLAFTRCGCGMVFDTKIVGRVNDQGAHRFD